MKQRLSSLQTFLMKIILPIIWITSFGIGVINSFIGKDMGSDMPPKTFFLIFWILGIAFLYWICIRLKTVSVDGNFLYVSNYIKEISIPLSDISDVTENRWINIHPVKIHLKTPSEFGETIIFMPKIRLFAFFSSHPVVNELKELVKESKFMK